jgi:DNA transposition AAA+ family ATPase
MLIEIHRRLHSGQESLKVEALYGLGGVGKTQVAVEYAHRYAADYTLVWWIDAAQPVFIPDQYRRLAMRLGLRADGPALDIVERVKAELRQHTRWLLVSTTPKGPRMSPRTAPPVPGTSW